MVDTSSDGLFRDELLGKLVDLLVDLGPGAKLPNEREQAELLGVSRTALRDRLSRLESMGVVKRRAGAGTFVHKLSAAPIADSIALGFRTSNIPPASIQAVRHGLERQAAIEATRTDHIDHMSLARMAVAVDRMDSSETSSELREADSEFHLALLAASGSQALIFFSDILQRVTDVTLQAVELAEEREIMRRLHRNIYEAVRNRDSVKATEAIDEHFAWLKRLTALRD